MSNLKWVCIFLLLTSCGPDTRTITYTTPSGKNVEACKVQQNTKTYEGVLTKVIVEDDEGVVDERYFINIDGQEMEVENSTEELKNLPLNTVIYFDAEINKKVQIDTNNYTISNTGNHHDESRTTTATTAATKHHRHQSHLGTCLCKHCALKPNEYARNTCSPESHRTLDRKLHLGF